MNIESLKNIGSEWIKGDMHRIYFNEPSQYLDGISNTKARKLDTYCKIWFDVKLEKFVQQGFAPETVKKIATKIKTLAE